MVCWFKASVAFFPGLNAYRVTIGGLQVTLFSRTLDLPLVTKILLNKAKQCDEDIPYKFQNHVLYWVAIL